METTKTLLMIWHSRTGAAREMTQAAVAGAHAIAQQLKATERLRIIVKPAGDACPQDLLDAQAYIFCAPENLGSLSGEMKEFFDRNYYPVLDKLNGRPYALMVSAGSDGSGAARQATRICTGWRLKQTAPALIVNTDAQTPAAILAPKTLSAQNVLDCSDVGGLMAALLL